jgi:hypothetical protein
MQSINNLSSIEEQVNQIFNHRDYKVFKWVFCRYICETRIEPITGFELFLRSGLEGYMHSEKSVKEYVLDNEHNVYRVFINRVLKGLVDKGLLKEVKQRYGDTEFIAFESTDLFKTKCPEFMRYLMGDIDTIG